MRATSRALHLKMLLYVMLRVICSAEGSDDDAGEERKQDVQKSSVPQNELSARVLYESFLPLDSLLFLIEINRMGTKETTDLIERTVLPARKHICKNIGLRSMESILEAFESMALNIPSTDKDLKASLEARNKYFKNDDSQIARNLFLDEHTNILAELKNGWFHGVDAERAKMLDERYVKMVLALRKEIIESSNLAKCVKRERHEFARGFGEPSNVSVHEVNDLRMIISLGGAIFEPNVLLALAWEIKMENKDKFIEKNVLAMTKPIVGLELLTRHKPNVEKKDIILSFLRACYRRQTWVHKNLLDEAFRARTSMLEAYLKHEREEVIIQKERMFDRYHESFLIDLINRVEGLSQEMFQGFLVINPATLELYIKLLQTGHQKFETALAKAFRP